jgi:hypothetical protein
MINVNSLSPLSISNSSIITLNGTNFGNDSSIVNVTIGKELCQVISINNSQIECFLEALQVGINVLQVYFEGISFVLFYSNERFVLKTNLIYLVFSHIKTYPN